MNRLQSFFKKRGFWCLGAFLAFGLSVTLLFILPALTQQPVTLNLLMPAPDVQPMREGMVKDFEAKNPGIRINLIEGPNAANLVEDLYTSAFLLGDSPYDLIDMDIIWTSKFAAAGWLLDLTERVTKEELAAFSPPDVEGGRYENRLYRMPIRSDVGMLYYREDLLKAAGLGPPETFEDLLKISQTLQKENKVNWGYVWQGHQ